MWIQRPNGDWFNTEVFYRFAIVSVAGPAFVIRGFTVAGTTIDFLQHPDGTALQAQLDSYMNQLRTSQGLNK